MKIDQQQLQELESKQMEAHMKRFDMLKSNLEQDGIAVEKVLKKLMDFQVAIPSWALGAGGTRFGRFSIGGEPGTLEEKIDDVAVIHALTQTAGAISLHIPWDIPSDFTAIKERAANAGLAFDAVNSNTFQDHKGQQGSYKYGSLSNESTLSRDEAIAHNIEVIKIGEQLGSKALTVW